MYIDFYVIARRIVKNLIFNKTIDLFKNDRKLKWFFFFNQKLAPDKAVKSEIKLRFRFDYVKNVNYCINFELSNKYTIFSCVWP